jgi:hypothetical protein
MKKRIRRRPCSANIFSSLASDEDGLLVRIRQGAHRPDAGEVARAFGQDFNDGKLLFLRGERG